ncbi:CD1375 family protein [Intestinibacter bartlettii]|nr:CD1375 family protein [Intestinibacter bartlettii]SCI51333.1 Uncharacterised protein [uncultured Clostridium sp.]SCJ12302.1 Uncharacterised protein [uncultured Clostridium sp.]
MARIYANLIEKKLKTIDDVPTRFKNAVLEILTNEGYNGYGEPLI